MSDQPKIQRLLQIIHLLSGPAEYTNAEIANQMGVSERTVERYIRTLGEAGYAIRRSNGRHHIVTPPAQASHLSHAILFSPLEAQLLNSLIASLTSDVPLRYNLQQKLSAVCENIPLVQIVGHNGPAQSVHLIATAIRRQHNVILCQYASAHSGHVADRHVEPVAFSENYTFLHAYDLDHSDMRTFRLSRIGSVTPLPKEPWSHAKSHHVPQSDIFHLNGDGHYHATLLLTMRAYDLLTEEYPMSQPHCKPLDDNDPHRIKGFSHLCRLDLCQLEGAGRFVLGLPGEVLILDGDELIDYCEQKKNIKLT